MQPTHARRILSEWLTDRHPSGVILSEDTGPRPDPDARYSVAYEAVFEPSSLLKARVEVWVTTDGEVALGLEKRTRIAQRLGVRSSSESFAAGHEPQRLSESGLLAMLNAIADGQIAIQATVIPAFGLVSTRAIAPARVVNAVVAAGYAPPRWLKVAGGEKFVTVRPIVPFQAW